MVDDLTGRAAVRRVAAARFLSGTGSSVAAVALAFYTFERTDSPYWLTLSMLATLGAPGLFMPVAGTLADRFDRRRIMIVSDLASAVCWLALMATESIAVLTALAFVAAIAHLPYWAATGAAIPNMVEQCRLTWANGLVSGAESAARLLGPVLGGAVFVAGGHTLAFAINAISFAASLALIVGIDRSAFSPDLSRDQDADPSRVGGVPAGNSLLVGFTMLWRDRQVRALVGASATTYFAINLALVADAPLTREFGVGSIGYGLIDASFGAGLLLGSWLGTRVDAANHWRWVMLGLGGLVAGWVTVAVAPVFAVVLAGNLAAALFDTIGAVTGDSAIQAATPDAVRGRVLAAADAISLAATLVALSLAGLLVDLVGARVVYLIGAAVALGGLAVVHGTRPTLAAVSS